MENDFQVLDNTEVSTVTTIEAMGAHKKDASPKKLNYQM